MRKITEGQYLDINQIIYMINRVLQEDCEVSLTNKLFNWTKCQEKFIKNIIDEKDWAEKIEGCEREVCGEYNHDWEVKINLAGDYYRCNRCMVVKELVK